MREVGGYPGSRRVQRDINSALLCRRHSVGMECPRAYRAAMPHPKATLVPGPAREASLYVPVKRFLEARGFEVKGEIGGCDLVALRDDEPPLVVIAS